MCSMVLKSMQVSEIGLSHRVYLKRTFNFLVAFKSLNVILL